MARWDQLSQQEGLTPYPKSQTGNVPVGSAQLPAGRAHTVSQTPQAPNPGCFRSLLPGHGNSRLEQELLLHQPDGCRSIQCWVPGANSRFPHPLEGFAEPPKPLPVSPAAPGKGRARGGHSPGRAPLPLPVPPRCPEALEALAQQLHPRGAESRLRGCIPRPGMRWEGPGALREGVKEPGSCL